MLCNERAFTANRIEWSLTLSKQKEEQHGFQKRLGCWNNIECRLTCEWATAGQVHTSLMTDEWRSRFDEERR